jgi:hypothetical protein
MTSRPNRVKTCRFTVGSLTADANEQIDSYSQAPLNGLLYGVHVGANTFNSSTGSLFLNVSGPELTVWSMVSGTTRGTGVGTSGVTYPRATTVTTDSVPLSGGNGYVEFAEMPLNSVLHLVGSKLGASASGLELNVVYI